MKRSILIVDDMDINREILAEPFRDKYDVIEAENGLVAIKYLADKSCSFFVDACAEICMHHHERYDGGGYPHKLQGDDITYFTNMASLCIEFDRMFFKREEYNDRQFDFIMREIEFESGRYDPDNIDLINKCRNQIMMYYKLLKKE